LSRWGICREEGLQELPWVDALSSGGLHQTGKDAVGFESAIRSGPQADFAEDHQMPKRLFGVVVGGRYPGAPQKGKEEFLFGSCEESPEGFSGFETKRLLADLVQLRDGAFFDLGRRLPGELAGLELLPHLAESRAQIPEAVAERAGSGVFLWGGVE